MDLTLQDYRSFQDMARLDVHDVFPHPDDHFPEGPEVLEELERELGAGPSGFSDSELENVPDSRVCVGSVKSTLVCWVSQKYPGSYVRALSDELVSA
jgi:hypothetical protein